MGGTAIAAFTTVNIADAFGGFFALSVYLPTYLVNAYELEASAAALRTAGFVVLAVAARPVGGIMSDKWHPVPVLVTCCVIAGVMAVLAALRLELLPAGIVAFLVLAAILGASSGRALPRYRRKPQVTDYLSVGPELPK